MKIALVQEERYLPTYHGGNKSNRLLLEALCRQGHDCLALSAVRLAHVPERQFLQEMAERAIEVERTICEHYRYRYRGVAVHGLPLDTRQRHDFIRKELRAFGPDIVLVSADPRYYLLAAALAETPDRVVYISHSNEHLPFGPLARRPDTLQRERLNRVIGIITVSRYAQRYLKQHGGLDATRLSFPVYSDGPFPRLGRFGQGAIGLLNAHPTKGVDVFIALARVFPAQSFVIVDWCGNRETQAELQTLMNVRRHEPVDEIHRILEQIQILLMPSLLPETFGLAAIEAMLHGIPVLASDIGGLTEAKQGVEYLLPVNPATEVHDGEFICPRQDCEPWQAALTRLLDDPAHYRDCADASRDAAARFVSAIDIRDFEDLFERIRPEPKTPQPVAVVDTFDAGFLFAKELHRRGYPCVNVISNDAIADEILAKCEPEYLHATVQHRGDIANTIQQLRDFGIKHILPGCETGVTVADALSAALGGITNGTALSEARRNKYLMAMAAKHAGVAVPNQCCTDRFEDVLSWLETYDQWPVVAKPPHSLGSEDVHVCRDQAELKSAFHHILNRTNLTGRVNQAVIVQELLFGPQYVLDTISYRGEHFLAGVWLYGRPEFAGSVIASPADPTQWHPSIAHLSWADINYAAVGSNSKRIMHGDDNVAHTLFAYASQILDALEINTGPAHFELMWINGEPRLIEVGARLHGALSTHWMCRICAGVSQLDQTIDAYLNPRQFLRRARHRYRLTWHGYKVRLHPWRAGDLKSFTGMERVEALPSFRGLFYMSEPKRLAPKDCVGVVALIHPDEDVMLRDFETIRQLEREDLFEIDPI